MKPSIRRTSVGHLRRSTVFLAAICFGPLLGGCVSAVEDTSAFGYPKTGPQEAAEAAKGIEEAAKEAGGDVKEASASEPATAGTTQPDIRSASATAAAPVRKENAAQAAADEARFGKPAGREAPIATGSAAIAAFAGASVLSSSQTDQGAPSSSRQSDSTMFASLYAQSKAKTPIRNVDVGKTRRVILARQGAPVDASDGSALPGVRGASSLFEIGQKVSADYDADIIDEASGEEGTYQTASISGLARLAPNGLMVQRPDVQTSCFQPELVSMIRAVESRFHTKIVVTSGYRSPSHNVRVRGAKRSMHLQCKAADILVPGADKFQVANFVRTLPNRGGVGTYCHTSAIHIDTGRQRDWNWACRRSPGNDRSVLLASQKVGRPSSDD